MRRGLTSSKSVYLAIASRASTPPPSSPSCPFWAGAGAEEEDN